MSVRKEKEKEKEARRAEKRGGKGIHGKPYICTSYIL